MNYDDMERRGEKIAGSKYFRGFCFNCEEPIRVESKEIALETKIICYGCRNVKPRITHEFDAIQSTNQQYHGDGEID